MVLVQLDQHPVVLDERRYGSGRARHRETGVEGVAPVAGVAEEMAGRDRGAVRGGDGRPERMAVGEVDAGVAQPGEGRGALGRDRGGAQPVGDEQDDVLLRLRDGGRDEGGEQQACAKQSHRGLPDFAATLS
jgi:hypothetical protein